MIKDFKVKISHQAACAVSLLKILATHCLVEGGQAM